MHRATALILVLVIIVIAVAVYGMTRHATTDATCQADSDCPGQICVAGACVPSPGGCATSTDCAANEVCTNGVCVATPSGSGCTVSTDCAAGQICLSGACVVPAKCDVTADCTTGTACRNGICVAPNCAVRNTPGGNRAYIVTNDALPGKTFRLGRVPDANAPDYAGSALLSAPTSGVDAKLQQIYVEPANNGFFLYTLGTNNTKWYISRDKSIDGADNHLINVPQNDRANFGNAAVWAYNRVGQLTSPDATQFISAERCSVDDTAACSYAGTTGDNSIAGPFTLLAADFACETLANTWTFTPVGA